MGLVGGGVMGLGMGVFLGAMSDMTPPVTVYKGKEVPQAPIKEQARAVLRQTGEVRTCSERSDEQIMRRFAVIDELC